jgi:predicted ATP-grasp superfamily ATP-dependent carboligase
MAVGAGRVTPRGTRPTVLMGFAEAMAAIEVAWSLQEAGYDVAAFGRAGRKSALRRVKGVTIHEVPGPEHDARGAVAAVSALCAQLRPDALLPLDDQALWVCQNLEDVAAPIAGGTGVAIDYALDKSLQIRAAADAGLPVPATQVLDDLAAAGPVEFPVMVKPARALYDVDGVLRRPTGVVCANAGELASAAAKPWPGTLLVQPLLSGVGEGLFGHMTERGVVGWSAHRRVRMVNPQGSASSACESAEVDKELVEPSERFLAAIGWRGLFMLEFLRDASGVPWFMELNGRAWGSMALARRRGFEYPAWTVQAALDPDFDPVPPVDPPAVLCRNLGLELVHLAFVARGPQSDAPMNWPTLGRSIRDVCTFSRGDRVYNWNRSQPGVLAVDVLDTLRSYGSKMLSRRS